MIYARLSYNSNDWIFPSGRNGKSNNKTTFEGVNGFGFEEWLFDERGTYNGWQYGYVEGIKQNFRLDDENHILKFYTLQYGILKTALRQFVSELSDWKKVDYLENRDVISHWQSNNRIETMRKELVQFNANILPFEEAIAGINKVQLVNIKFKQLPIVKLTRIPQNHEIQKYNYFKLKR